MDQKAIWNVLDALCERVDKLEAKSAERPRGEVFVFCDACGWKHVINTARSDFHSSSLRVPSCHKCPKPERVTAGFQVRWRWLNDNCVTVAHFDAEKEDHARAYFSAARRDTQRLETRLVRITKAARAVGG